MTVDRLMARDFLIAAASMTLLQMVVRVLLSGGPWTITQSDILLSAGLAAIFVVGRRVGGRP